MPVLTVPPSSGLKTFTGNRFLLAKFLLFVNETALRLSTEPHRSTQPCRIGCVSVITGFLIRVCDSVHASIDSHSHFSLSVHWCLF